MLLLLLGLHHLLFVLAAAAAAAALTLAFLFFFLFPFLLASLGWRTGNYRVAVWHTHTLLGLAIVCTSSGQKRGSEELSERVFPFPAAVAAII